METEQVQQRDGEDESGDGIEDEQNLRGAAVEPAVAFQGLGDAEGNRDGVGE